MKKSLAQFKRDAASDMSLEIVERFGSTDIIERLRGVRKVVKVNSNSIVLMNQDGQESYLYLERASLIEYDGDTLTVYAPIQREPTQEEQTVLDRAYKAAEEYRRACPWGNSNWKVAHYILDSPCPWMEGCKTIKGKSYDGKKVTDRNIKGNAILKYRVYMGN